MLFFHEAPTKPPNVDKVVTAQIMHELRVQNPFLREDELRKTFPDSMALFWSKDWTFLENYHKMATEL